MITCCLVGYYGCIWAICATIFRTDDGRRFPKNRFRMYDITTPKATLQIPLFQEVTCHHVFIALFHLHTW